MTKTKPPGRDSPTVQTQALKSQTHGFPTGLWSYGNTVDEGSTERDSRSSCLTGLKAVTIQAQSSAYCLAHSRDSINGSSKCSLVWPLNMWFAWLHFINQAYSQHHLIGPPDLKPCTSRCQGPQAKTGYFICMELNIWHGFPPNPIPSPVPNVLMASFDPSGIMKLKRIMGPIEMGAFSPPPSVRPAKDSQNSLQMLHCWAAVGEVGLPLPQRITAGPSAHTKG